MDWAQEHDFYRFRVRDYPVAKAEQVLGGTARPCGMMKGPDDPEETCGGQPYRVFVTWWEVGNHGRWKKDPDDPELPPDRVNVWCEAHYRAFRNSVAEASRTGEPVAFGTRVEV